MVIAKTMEAIKQTLQKKFGSDYQYYMDEFPQMMESPAFAIHLLKLEHTPQLNGRAKLTLFFNVLYSPKAGQIEAATQAFHIQRALQEITLQDEMALFAKGTSSELLAGQAHNFMYYDFHLQAQQEEVRMELFHLKEREIHT